MESLFILLWLVSFVIMVISTIKPNKAIIPYAKKSRKRAFLVWFSIGFLCLVLVGVTSSDSPTQEASKSETNSENAVVNNETQENDSKELDDTKSEEVDVIEPEKEVTPEETVLQEPELIIHTQDDYNMIGDIVIVGDMAVQVMDAQLYKGSGFDEPDNGYQYLLVYVGVSNYGTDIVYYSDYDFQIATEEGVLIDPAILFNFSGKALESGELLANGFVEGAIVFEVPQGDTGLKLYYVPNIWFDDEATFIDLSMIRNEFIYLKDL